MINNSNGTKTLGESFSLENNQSSHISLTVKKGLMDIRMPAGMSAIEIESWNDLENKILNMFNSRVRNEDKQLFVIYQNKLFSQNSFTSSLSLCGENEYEDNMYEEIVQTFNLATREEAELVILQDEKTWKKIWKYLKKVFKIRNRRRDDYS